MHMLYVTIKDTESATALATTLVEEGLVACANIGCGHTAIYRWNGELCTGNEVHVILKTTDNLVGQVTERVVALHHDEVPCVIAWPITDGNPDYLAWLQSSVQKGNKSPH